MSEAIGAAAWPPERLPEALFLLARRAGLPAQAVNVSMPPGVLSQREAAVWIEAVAQRLGLEAESCVTDYPLVEAWLHAHRPALVRLSDGRFLALLGRGRVIAPDRSIRRVPLSAVRDVICERLEQPYHTRIETLLRSAGIAARKQNRARRAMLDEQLAHQRITGLWRLRLPAEANFLLQMRRLGLSRRVVALLGLNAIYQVLWLASWWLIGVAALEGRLDRGWLLAWALLLFTLVPIRVRATWLEGAIAIPAGWLLKQRLLAGVLHLDTEEILEQGAGQLLGRVLESDAVESLALAGGFQGAMTGLEILFAGAVLALGGAPWRLLLLGIWTAAAVWLGFRYLGNVRCWAGARLKLSDDLIETMVGHRTRLAQQPPERWHEAEDQALDGYVDLSRRRDRSEAIIAAILPRGWLVIGLIALAPQFLAAGADAAGLAATLGGVIIAQRAFKRFAAALWALADARIAWEQVQPIFHAGGRAVEPGDPAFALAPTRPDGCEAVAELHEAVFSYPERGEPVLRHASLSLRPGDRALLEGPSGGGKSTLVSLLAGLRAPQAGLVLAGGLDIRTLGMRGWRHRVVMAPQFHQNHIITGSFAFNLFIGCLTPPEPAEQEEARAICCELGLGELLSRMPGGFEQIVGETGWQLSHGERSRVYIARALLQHAELVILDESFAALDPETLQRAIQCVIRRAPTLLAVAHP